MANIAFDSVSSFSFTTNRNDLSLLDRDKGLIDVRLHIK
jgi:hypothetical protein